MRSAALAVILLIAACTTQATPSAQPVPATGSVDATAAPTAIAPTVSPSPIALPTVSPSPIPLPTNVQLSVPSGSVVWALVAGTRLFRSLDGGDTWQERLVPVSATNIRMSFISDREGWLLTNMTLGTPCPVQSIRIWHTADGAATWSEMAPTGIADAGCKDGIDFVTPTVGFVRLAGQDQAPILYRTTDGGRSWNPTPPLAEPPGFARTADVRYWSGPVHAFESVLLVRLERQANPGETDFVYRSVDGGVSWTYLAKLPFPNVPGFITATRWVELSLPGYSQETTDAGATWHLSLSDYGQAAPVAPQVEFGDPQIGYATVRGFIQRTVDGGTHWTSIRTPGTT